jgi:hypothetical protein
MSSGKSIKSQRIGSLSFAITSISLDDVCSPRANDPNKARLATGYLFWISALCPKDSQNIFPRHAVKLAKTELKIIFGYDSDPHIALSF